MNYGETIQVIGNFFRITFIENPGLAFGFDPGLNFKFWISLFSLVASIALVVYLYVIRKKPFSTRFAVALILGGAIGNLIDRLFYGVFYGYAPLFYGRVVDFLDFDFFKFSLLGRNFDRWPIYNVADASVTIGVLLLVFFYPKDKKEVSAAGMPLQSNNSFNEKVDENNQDISNNQTRNTGSLEELKEKKLNNENVEPNLGKKISDTDS